MEGYLEKKDEGYFGGWNKYYFILHEEMLYQLDKKEGNLSGRCTCRSPKCGLTKVRSS
jgi:hypothetical protein